MRHTTYQQRGRGLRIAMMATIGVIAMSAPLLALLPGRHSPPAPVEDTDSVQQIVLDYIDSNGFEGLVGNSPRIGAENPTILLVEFSDFQCPYCAQAHSVVKEFVENHGDRVAVVYRHLPLDHIHPQATPAARAAWAAQQQGEFWAYHDGLFENQAALGEELYLLLAEELSLDIEQFNTDRHSDAALQAIETDVAIADRLRFRGTPTFVMNGVLLPGFVPLAVFEEVLTELDTMAAAQDLQGDSPATMPDEDREMADEAVAPVTE